MTKIGWRLLFLLLLASAWGLAELIGGETVWLTAWALLLLVVARTVINRPGSSTAIALVAVLFKSINTAPFVCHLAGIAILGIAFDLTATLLWRDEEERYVPAILAGVNATFLSCFLFAASMVWIVEYKHWAGGGWEKVGEYTLASGGRGALTALVVVPLGLLIGTQLVRRAKAQPHTMFGAAAAASATLWVLGPFVG